MIKPAKRNPELRYVRAKRSPRKECLTFGIKNAMKNHCLKLRTEGRHERPFLCLTKRNGAPVQAIAWVLEHVSACAIIATIHAWTLHSFLCGKLTLELRVGKWLVVKVAKANALDRTR